MLNDSIGIYSEGILSTSSRVAVDVSGTLTVTNNTANDTDGGIYITACSMSRVLYFYKATKQTHLVVEFTVLVQQLC